jgi:hypothetical protein
MTVDLAIRNGLVVDPHAVSAIHHAPFRRTHASNASTFLLIARAPA